MRIVILTVIVVVVVVQARRHLAFRRPRVAPRSRPGCRTSSSTAWWVDCVFVTVRECVREHKKQISNMIQYYVVCGEIVYRDQLPFIVVGLKTEKGEFGKNRFRQSKKKRGSAWYIIISVMFWPALCVWRTIQYYGTMVQSYTQHIEAQLHINLNKLRQRHGATGLRRACWRRKGQWPLWINGRFIRR